MSANCGAGVLSLLLLASGSGCATKALWDNGNLEAVKEPAGDVNLRLFAAQRRNDWLVVYDEYSERSDTTHTRAYWLNENQTRVDQRRAPHFASTRLTRDLSPVPVLESASTDTNRVLTEYAVIETNRQAFTLYGRAGQISRHDLPTYNDGKGRVEKIALTPVAATADLTIVGGYLGIYFIYALAQSGYSTH